MKSKVDVQEGPLRVGEKVKPIGINSFTGDTWRFDLGGDAGGGGGELYGSPMICRG